LAEAIQQLDVTLFKPELVFMTEQGTTAEQQILSSSSSNSSTKVWGQSTAAAAATLASPGVLPSASVVPLIHSSSSSYSSSRNAPKAAPLYEFRPVPQPGVTQMTSLTLGLDVLVFAPDTMPLPQLSQQLLIPALKQQLATMAKQLLAQPELLPVRAFHFQPPQWAHPITVCYPQLAAEAEANDLKLTSVRQQLHGLLGLPGNVPLLRQTYALAWPGAGDSAATAAAAAGNRAVRLQDVHATLPAPGGD
jgi:hypothetical protein